LGVTKVLAHFDFGTFSRAKSIFTVERDRGSRTAERRTRKKADSALFYAEIKDSASMQVRLQISVSAPSWNRQ